MYKTLILGLGGIGSNIASCAADKLANVYGDGEQKVQCAVLNNCTSEFEDAKVPVIDLSTYTSADDDLDVKLSELTDMLNKTLHDYRDGMLTGINIILVGTACGNFGTGILIPLALWLRRFFLRRNIRCTVKSILLLPDVMIHSHEALKLSREKQHQLKYTCCKTLHAIDSINKIKTGIATAVAPMQVGELWHSEAQQDGAPLMDMTYLVDAADCNGNTLTCLNDYIDIVASAAVIHALDSRVNEHELVPLTINSMFFGSLGVSRMEFPKNELADYCTSRALSETVSVWCETEIETALRIRYVQDCARDNIPVPEPIDPISEYIRITNSLTENENSPLCNILKADAEAFGSIDRYISDICTALDIELEKLTGDRSLIPQRADNIYDSMATVEHIQQTHDGLCAEFESKKQWLVQLITARMLNTFDLSATNNSDSLSLYSRFRTNDGCMHPVSVKYTLCKLLTRLKEIAKPPIKHDPTEYINQFRYCNKQQLAPLEYLEKKPLYLSERNFVKKFFDEFILICGNMQDSLQKYMANTLRYELYTALISEYLPALISRYTELLHGISDLSRKDCDKMNINSRPCVLHIYPDKDGLYSSLDKSGLMYDGKLSAYISDVIFSNFFAEFRPECEYNRHYTAEPVHVSAHRALTEFIKQKLCHDNPHVFDMDIMHALVATAGGHNVDTFTSAAEARLNYLASPRIIGGAEGSLIFSDTVANIDLNDAAGVQAPSNTLYFYRAAFAQSLENIPVSKYITEYLEQTDK